MKSWLHVQLKARPRAPSASLPQAAHGKIKRYCYARRGRCMINTVVVINNKYDAVTLVASLGHI